MKKFTVPDGMLNDWTGNRFMKYPHGIDRNMVSDINDNGNRQTAKFIES